MLFNHYMEETEKNVILEACKNHDFDRAFNACDHLGSYDYDRSCDLLALAVAGVKGTRRALLRGVALASRGGFYFSIPGQREVRDANDRDLVVESSDRRVSVNVPVLRTEADAKRWVSGLNGDEEELARDFLSQLHTNAWSAYKEIGQYIEGVSYIAKPDWL